MGKTEPLVHKYDILRYFTGVDNGGYSTCITEYTRPSFLDHPWWEGSTISNCVGLAAGLFNLVRGRGRLFKWPKGHANTLYATCRKPGSGYMTSKDPHTFGVCCYDIGEMGHVLFILWAFSKTRCVGIESNFTGTTANKRLLRILIGNPRKWYTGYQGCITDFT